jgi:hypothetical protein
MAKPIERPIIQSHLPAHLRAVLTAQGAISSAPIAKVSAIIRSPGKAATSRGYTGRRENVSAKAIPLAPNEIIEAMNCAKMPYGGLAKGVAIPNFD